MADVSDWFGNALAQADREIHGMSVPYQTTNSGSNQTIQSPDLINSAVDQRVNLINRGIDPDRPALYVSPQRQTELLHNTLLGAEASHANLVNQEHYSSAKSFTHFANDLAELSASGLEKGTPEWEHRFLQITADPRNAEGLHGESGIQLARAYGLQHDNAAGLKQRQQDRLDILAQKKQDALELIKARGEGKATEREQKALQTWMAKNGINGQDLENADQVWKQSPDNPDKVFQAVPILDKATGKPVMENGKQKVNYITVDKTHLAGMKAIYDRLPAFSGAGAAPTVETQPQGTTAPVKPTPETIRAAVKAGTMTRDEGIKQLQGLGFE